MKILLFGEYSNLHVALAEGLRRLGHQVTVISNGNKWRGYKRDIDLCREGTGKWAAVKYVAKLLTLLPRLRGYDVVQLINPDFLELKAEREFAIFRYLRRNNRSIDVIHGHKKASRPIIGLLKVQCTRTCRPCTLGSHQHERGAQHPLP